MKISKQKLVERVRRAVRANLREDLTVDDLPEELGLVESQLEEAHRMLRLAEQTLRDLETAQGTLGYGKSPWFLTNPKTKELFSRLQWRIGEAKSDITKSLWKFKELAREIR
jgi:hypothetical protein